MQTYIALLRGINVGGHHKLPMKELKNLLGELGLKNVQTYIASGNVVFQTNQSNTAELASKISAAINDNHGFQPRILLLTREEMETAVQTNPYPEAEIEPKTLHLYFLTDKPENPDLPALQALQKDNERFQLIDRVFYLHAPDGIGRSKLAEKVERHLSVPATARNWRTVTKIMDMLPQ
jgi:uncharacterized protein (DUF1697 family)